MMVYLQHQSTLMQDYVIMKSRSDNFVVSEDVLWEYLKAMVSALVIIESVGFKRHGNLGFHSLSLQKERLKVMFNPLYQLSCL